MSHSANPIVIVLIMLALAATEIHSQNGNEEDDSHSDIQNSAQQMTLESTTILTRSELTESEDVHDKTENEMKQLPLSSEEDVVVSDNENSDNSDETWEFDKHGILLLNRDNFDAAIDKFDYLLVNFYTPSCSQCVLLHPHFVQAWKHLQQIESEAQFAMIDCSNETALLKHYGIVQFPTITFFKRQQEKMYDGGYRSGEMITWVTKRLGPPAIPLNDVETLEAAIKENKVVVVGFFKEENASSVVLYRYVADVIHDYPFFVTSEHLLFQHFNVEEDKVVIFKQFDEKRVEMDGTKFKADELADFLRLETLPLLVTLDMDNVWTITDEHSPIKTHLLLFINGSDHSRRVLEETLSPVAQRYKGKIIFVVVDAIDTRMMHLLEFFGVDRNFLRDMRIFRYDAAPTFKYRPDRDGTPEQTDGDRLEADRVDKFCSDFLAGRLKPFSLSQPLNQDWDSGNIAELVADNYYSVVSGRMEGDTPSYRYVFTMLYAPWCSHCQRQMPEFELAAGLYSKHRHQLRFARMDATANEVDHLEVTSYPTYILYTPRTGTDNSDSNDDSDSKGSTYNTVQCNDSRTALEFVHFLNEHTSVKLDVEEVKEALDSPEDQELREKREESSIGNHNTNENMENELEKTGIESNGQINKDNRVDDLTNDKSTHTDGSEEQNISTERDEL